METDLTAGSPQPNPYRRAFVAIHDPFALNRPEAVHYTTATDNEGRALDGSCSYKLMGREPDARWWSITAYGADGYLIPNPAHRYSVSNTAIAPDASGSFAVQIGGATGGADWIPVGLGPFSLMLRLYNPGPGIVFDPAHAALPALTKVSCP